MDQKKEELNCWTEYEISKEMAESCRGHVLETNLRAVGGKEWSVQSIRDHIFEFLCSKNEMVYRYVINWLASIVQRPWFKTKVGLVFISQEGIGKDLLFTDIMGSILGQRHHFSTSNVDDLIGRFASGLEGKTLVVFDEADMITDAQIGKIKDIISSNTLRMERKGQDTLMIDNYVNTVFNTNVQTKSIMTIGPQSRRFMVCLCDSSVNTIPGYFDQMAAFLGINDGTLTGVKAFADFLYNIDLSLWNPRMIPHTRYLILMKLGTMPSVHRWWLESLKKFSILRNNDQLAIPIPGWEMAQIEMKKSEFFDNYRTWNIKRNEDIDMSHFVILIKQVCPSLNTSRRVGGHTSNERERMVSIPPMRRCREEFRNYYRGMSFEEEMDLTETIDVHNPQFVPDWRISTAPSLDSIVIHSSQHFDVDVMSQVDD